MEKTINCLYIKLKYNVNYSCIVAQGTVNGDYKLLKFSVGNNCTIKFRTKKIPATILAITPKYVLVSVNDTTKRVSHEDFIYQNAYIETIIRIEKNGSGPYTAEDVSESFKEWRKEHNKEIRNEFLEKGYSSRPAPSIDSYLKKYLGVSGRMHFAFSNHNQLFSWFSLEEVQAMIKEGFEIVVYQKGRDYFDSFYSNKQIGFAKTREAFDLIEKSISYFPFY